MPNIGEKVQIKPAAGLMVLYAPARFLSNEGMEVIWTPFLEERLRTGEVEIVHSEQHLEELRQARFNAAAIELAPRVLEPGESLVPAAPEVGPLADPAAVAAALEGLGATLSPVKE